MRLPFENYHFGFNGTRDLTIETEIYPNGLLPSIHALWIEY